MSHNTSRTNPKKPNKYLDEVLQIVLRHEKEIGEQLSRHFQASAFENRYTLHPRRLADMGKEFLAEFIDFLKAGNPESPVGQTRKTRETVEVTILLLILRARPRLLQ